MHHSSKYPRILIAGTHSGVGKTTITLGLMSALKEKGHKVQGFKAGPDYIDPSHHTAITQKPSRNLDTWLMSRDVCLELYEHALTDSDMAVIEGVMGLYDGCLDGSELGSTAHLAKILNVPAILVMDAKGMSRSAGAVVLGYKNFDRDVKIRGIILNRVKSERHYASLKKSIEGHCGIPVLGYMPFHEDITLPERHLGLIPSVEQEFSKSTYQKIGNLLSSTVDIDQLYIGGGFPELYAAMLAANTTMKESIRKAHKNGVVIYGECGGMMYLLEQLVDFKKKTHEMCGILRGMTRMENKRQGLGYITVQALQDNILCKKGDMFKGHEFHWSSLPVPAGTPYAYAISKCDDRKLHKHTAYLQARAV